MFLTRENETCNPTLGKRFFYIFPFARITWPIVKDYRNERRKKMITLAILIIIVILAFLAIDIAIGVLIASLFGSIVGFIWDFGWIFFAGLIIFKIVSHEIQKRK